MINKKKYHIAGTIQHMKRGMTIRYLCGRNEYRRHIKHQSMYNHSGICKQCLAATNK